MNSLDSSHRSSLAHRVITLATLFALVAMLLSPLATLAQTADGTPADPPPAEEPAPDTNVPADPTATVEPTTAPVETVAAPEATNTEAPAPTETTAPAPADTVAPEATSTTAPEPTATRTFTDPPTIQSDKDDYPPGGRVTLTGANWQPGEVVHIYVNDDHGSSWSRNVDVVADETGHITDAFNLPDWFVAEYSVVATGSISGTVRNSFTDALEIISATLNGGPTATVAPSTSVSAAVSLKSTSNSDWRATSWKIGSGTAVCADHPDHTSSSGTFTESFTITAPSSVGTFDVFFIGYSTNNCTGSALSQEFKLTGSLVVQNAAQGTTLTAQSATGTYAGTVTLTATLTRTTGGTPVSGKTVDFNLNGISVGSATTDSSGVATLNAGLGTINAGTYATGVGASFTADSSFLTSSGTASLTVNKGTPTITWSNPAAITFGTALGGTQLNATANVPGTFVYSPVAGTVLGAGTQTLNVTFTPTDSANYNNATKSVSVTVGKADQTITFAQPTSPATFGTTFTIAPTASSGLTVTVTASGGCTINGSDVTITSGTTACVLTANQAGNANFNAAPEVQRTVAAQKADQAIAFTSTAPSAAKFNDTYTPVATGGGSGNPVSFGASGACSFSSGTVTMTSVGTCTVTADQAGNSNYNAAPQATQVFSVAKANQTITVGTHAPATATYNTSFTVAASASSGLPVSYSSAGVCTNSGATFTMTSGTGTCTVKYDQAGNANYNAATQVTEAVTATKANQTISFTQPVSPRAYLDTFTVAPIATSGLNVAVSAAGGCTISGATVTMSSGVNDCVLTAKQGGDSNYSAAPDVVRTVAAKPWTNSGFFQPVENNRVPNGTKLGNTVPLKFKLYDANGVAITSTTAIVSIKAVEVGGNAVGTDDIEQYATGGTSLRYDASSGMFIYNFQFAKTKFAVGHSYEVTITFADGSTVSAIFLMK